MSHRALVGIPAAGGGPGGEIDLHVSPNGADQLKLFPVLEEYARRGDTRSILGVDDVPTDLTAEIEAIQESFGAGGTGRPLVEATPTVTDQARSRVGETVDFVQFEAVFIVTGSETDSSSGARVDVYLPAFANVGIVPFFARFVEFEVYPRDSLPDDHEAAVDVIQAGEVMPAFSRKQTEYLELDADSEGYEHFIEAHQGLLQTLYSLPPDSQRDELTSVVVTESAFVVGRIDTSDETPLPDPRGAGLLIRLPVDEFRYEQLANLYSDWAYLVDRLRVEHSLDALRDFIASLEGETGSTLTMDEHYDSFLHALDEEFGDSIATCSPRAQLDRLRER